MVYQEVHRVVGTAARLRATHRYWQRIHQGSGGFSGNNSDVEVQAHEAIGLVTRCTEIMARHTGQPFDRVKRDTERDYFMGADEAVAPR